MNTPIELLKDRLRKALRIKNITQQELSDLTGIPKASISQYISGYAKPKQDRIFQIATALKINEAWLLGYDVAMTKEQTNVTPIQLGDSISIPVFGSVPAGVPIEAIQDINEYIDIPKSWTTGGKEYFALTVKGDSMYPKYLDGDVVVIRVEEDCESGQDCVVYINGYDATLKKVIKRDDYLILQPLNTKYEPRMFDLRDDATPQVKIAGVVVEIRRRV